MATTDDLSYRPTRRQRQLRQMRRCFRNEELVCFVVLHKVPTFPKANDNTRELIAMSTFSSKVVFEDVGIIIINHPLARVLFNKICLYKEAANAKMVEIVNER